MEGCGGHCGGVRVVGDYLLGPRIGAGSFAVVWRARHRLLGLEVAVKEIDKKQLSSKLKESLFQEIDILRNISHPNIIRLHEAIQTEEKIFLVLEYCTGGDLAAYINRHGRVSEAVARHFMQQLASGLHVLRENNLIHRDLKPQNLLLSTRDDNSVLKIGDFGFARYLMPQGLADTLCGSPLYMAPEIIQNQKYDAKADLWSVGAILFQLVTGKPPFDGNSQVQLFQNILTSNELHFPHDILGELQHDCIDLCKSLLRVNPGYFLNPRHQYSDSVHNDGEVFEGTINVIGRLTNNIDEKIDAMLEMDRFKLKLDIYRDYELVEAVNRVNPVERLTFEEFFSHKFLAVERTSRAASEVLHNTEDDKLKIAVCVDLSNSSEDAGAPKMVASVSKGDSLESVEWEYVLVNPNLTSVETIFSSLEASLLEGSMTRPICILKKVGKGISGELALGPISGLDGTENHVSAPEASLLMELNLQRASLSHPSKRLQLLCQYVDALSEVAKEKLSAGLHLESFSVELVTLAVWKESVRICSDWLSSSSETAHHSSSTKDQESVVKDKSISLSRDVDFSRAETVYSLVEQGFLAAFDRAEMISNDLQDMDGNSEMPDAMEIIFQTALTAGKRGAVDELMGNRRNAVVAYSKATTLLSFILMEATSLRLNPPFSLPASDQQRIYKYITSLQSHLNQPQIYHQSTKETDN